jgi:hypothetical protein
LLGAELLRSRSIEQNGDTAMAQGTGSTQLAATDPRSLVDWTAQSAQLTVRRAIALARLIDRADRALDDIAELRRSAQYIAENLADLSKSAKGIDRKSDPLDNTVARLGRFVDGPPGGRRTAARSARAVESQEKPR